MAIRFTYCSALAVLLIAGMLISGELVSAINCDNDLIGLASKCQKYVVKQGSSAKPSPECCKVVKNVNVPCVCSHVTKQIEDLISMKKVFDVAKSCGKKVTPGTKCGSYTVPN
ncbi:protein LIM3 [Ricinus communis]|uniref:Lipid binding protein, putative n=1 Tax=Ricinus communis TaxID=3988 RepID=B9RIH4_RICCO|nr:protein LIM3 [Ricinus communis]EEF48946.1 lipid binding protein, putative [Ricinus communis]|eukprot:XP_002513543.1 protein LIM3 [Ricinus communis]